MAFLKTPWSELTFVAFDTETSGKYPLQAQICEIAAVKWQGGKVIDSFETLVDPGFLMSDEVIAIHGIKNDMVQGAPKIAEVIESFWSFIKGCIPAAHHAPFDLGFVTPEFESKQLELPEEPVLCTSLLSRKLVGGVPNHRLQTLVKHFNIDVKSAHRALDDAKACLEVLIECCKKLDEKLEKESASPATLASLLKVQEQDLSWIRYSMEDLKEKDGTSKLVRAIQNNQNVSLTYSGGSRPGKSREVKPAGIVRSPTGDFLVATEIDQEQSKRYYLNRVSKVEIIH